MVARALLASLIQLIVFNGLVLADSVLSQWPLVHISDPVARRNLIQALESASTRLGRDQCRQILTDFPEHRGSLTDSLSALSVDLRTYPTMVVFVDGSREAICIKGGLAFTAPGSRVVRVCVEELKRTWTQNPEHTIAALIHEVLHTLGLGENPPLSSVITARVLWRCGDRARKTGSETP